MNQPERPEFEGQIIERLMRTLGNVFNQQADLLGKVAEVQIKEFNPTAEQVGIENPQSANAIQLPGVDQFRDYYSDPSSRAASDWPDIDNPQSPNAIQPPVAPQADGYERDSPGAAQSPPPPPGEFASPSTFGDQSPPVEFVPPSTFDDQSSIPIHSFQSSYAAPGPDIDSYHPHKAVTTGERYSTDHEDDRHILELMNEFGEENRRWRHLVIYAFQKIINDLRVDNVTLHSLIRHFELSRRSP